MYTAFHTALFVVVFVSIWYLAYSHCMTKSSYLYKRFVSKENNHQDKIWIAIILGLFLSIVITIGGMNILSWLLK